MSKTSPQNCTFTESNSDILTLSNSQKNFTSSAANGKAESKGANSIPAPQHPDYVQTIKIKDSNGQIKELIFPKGLDLDRPKRARTTFSNDQLASLEREFRRNQYLVGRERSQLAVNLGLSETQVKVWYQNRRTKHKRDREREQEEYSPANLSCLLSSSLSSYSSQSTNQSTSFYPFSNMSPNFQSISLNRDLFSTNHTPIGIKLELSNPAKLSKVTESITSTVFEKPNDNDTKREERRNVGPELTKQSKAEESPQTHHSLGIERLIGNDKSELKKSQCEIPADQSVRETSLSTLFGTFQSVPQDIASRSAFRPLMGRPFHPLYYLNSTGYQGWMS